MGAKSTSSQFKVYPIHGLRPIRGFGQYLGVAAMAIDPWNDVYTTNASPDSGEIIAYAPGGTSRLLRIRFGATALAFDAAGNLYEADGVALQEYVARSTKLLRIISKQTRGGDALAFDRAGNLYLGRSHGSVEVFAPGAYRPFLTITDGLRLALALLIDPAGNLFVANCPSVYGHIPGSVVEFPPGSATPTRTLTQGVNTPVAMALGHNGLLFVANDPYRKPGWVSVYSKGTKPVRAITDGIDGPDALAVDKAGNLYVADWSWTQVSDDKITVYSPDGTRLLRTIRQGVSAPAAIAIGRE